LIISTTFGRFRGKEIYILTEYWGAMLALRAARYYKAEVSELIAPVFTEFLTSIRKYRSIGKFTDFKGVMSMFIIAASTRWVK
jgi:hypothetical protein